MSRSGEPGPEGRPAPVPVKIAYCDGPRLRRALLAAYEHLSSRRAELDRINVFPVADGDTGTNLALTLRAVAEAVRPMDTRSVSEVAHAAAEASVVGARGNSGMLVAHLLLGFSRSLGERIRAGTGEIARALEEAAAALGEALDRPVEGTILTVSRETAAAAARIAADRGDLYEWLRGVREAARDSLRRTRDALPALREAGVVDAGAKGFVSMLDGTLRYIEGRPLQPGGEPSDTAEPPVFAAGPAGAAGGEDAAAGDPGGRFCTQIVLRGGGVPGEGSVRRRLRGLGTSLVVAQAGGVTKVHVHTDEPDAVERRLAPLGEVASRRVEDTRQSPTTRRVALVTDSSSDLPAAWARRAGVEVVPLQVIVGRRTYRDGVELGPGRLLEILRDPEAPAPTTSQAAPGAFLEAYRRVLDGGAEVVLGVFLSSAVSGTFDAASTAARRLEAADPVLVDSRSGSMGLGMMVMRAVELLDAGWSVGDVVDELERIRARSDVLFTVEDLEGLLRSGRVGRARAWLGDVLGLRPVLGLDESGHVVPRGRARGRDGAREIVLERMDEALEGVDRCRMAVVHAGVPAFAGRLRDELESRYDPVETHVRPLTAVIAAHLGAGAWGVCYQVED